MRNLIIISLCLASLSCYADSFSPQASYQVCFTPGGRCTTEIVNAIKAARHTILVQAYSFTSHPIIKALVKAKDRGVTVKILLDKSLIPGNNDYYTPVPYLKKHDIWMRVDAKPNIAHNKVMVIDNNVVITGSFNFTNSAQKYNAENLLIIKDKKLAKKYSHNWYKREKQSLKRP